MIDPQNVTNYHRTPEQLEEFILFCVLVAGKNARTTANNLDKLLRRISTVYSHCKINHNSPFALLWTVRNELNIVLKEHGFGCYNIKADTIIELITIFTEDVFGDMPNLATCTVWDLEKIKGIGRKTSRYFILHTRARANVAALDTHILKYLRDNGYLAPLATPQSNKYYYWEQIFLKLVPPNMTVAEFDLDIWNRYSKNGKYARNTQASLNA